MPANKTRSKKEGSVYRRDADGMWCASIELPSNGELTKTGKLKRRRKVVVAKSKTEVLRKLSELKKLNPADITTGNITLAEWMTTYREQIAVKNNRPGTTASARSKIGYITDSIGGVRLDKLTPAHVRKLHDHITNLGLSSSTLKQTHSILTKALRYAEMDGKVTRNVAKLTDTPRAKKAVLTVLTGSDGIRILQTVAGERMGSRWAAALLTGARQGELLGLEIDRVTEVLDLSWKLERVIWAHGCAGTCERIRGTDCPKRKIDAPDDWEHRHLTGGLYLSRPKSAAGWRIIPLVDPLRSIIERRVEISLTEPNPHNLLWTADPKKTRHGGTLPLDGSPIDPRIDNEAWHAVLERAGIQQVRLHDARHTTVDLLYEAGVSEAVIQEIVGHSTVSMSRAYKSRGNQTQLREAMSALSALMSPQ